jgi:hypothetical protein
MRRRWQDRNIENEVEIERRIFVGVDFGQKRDYSAVSVVESVRTIAGGSRDELTSLQCIHLQRWALNTSFPKIVADTVNLVNSLSARALADKPTLSVDATGLGLPLVDMFKEQTFNARFVPIYIIGNGSVNTEGGITRVPKRDLISATQIALQNRKLKIASQLPEADTLVRELSNYKVKISDSGHDSYSAWRESIHDDLVLSLALAVWCAGQKPFRVSQAEKELFSGLAGNRY